MLLHLKSADPFYAKGLARLHSKNKRKNPHSFTMPAMSRNKDKKKKPRITVGWSSEPELLPVTTF